MEAQISKKGLSTNKLKLIAVLAMVVDHVAVILVPQSFAGMWVLHFVGRFTAPIMCFFIAEGYYHTHSLSRYMGRLLILAIASHFPHNTAFGFSVLEFWAATDVIFALLFGLIALAFCKETRFPIWLKAAVTLLCCGLAYSADWNYIAVLYILVLGLFHGFPKRQLAGYIGVSCLYLLQGVVYSTTMPFLSRFGVFCVIPIILLYNGERGKKNWITKWGFYIFYPVHLMILYGISRIV